MTRTLHRLRSEVKNQCLRLRPSSLVRSLLPENSVMKQTNNIYLLTLALAVAMVGAGASAAYANTRTSGPAEKVDMVEAETLLSNLGYWILKVDGKIDSSTRSAIVAFQKVEGRKRTGILNPADMEWLRSAQPPKARFQIDGVHVEIDLTRQVLFLFDDSRSVPRILPVSSGNEKRYFDEGKWQIAHTPRGNFRIERKINGVRKASLGDLYYPSYFYGGVAIHGSNSIPFYPASHGCVRIPRFADRAFSQMVRVGTEVIVYD
jgi:lipoprotein-anchoring transpeptidase ErfK/SrfK